MDGLFSFSGTYTVNSDFIGCCDSSLTRGITSSTYFVLVEDEKYLYTISPDPGLVIIGVFTKVIESHSDEER